MTVLAFTVYGTPKPKGSLRHVGGGRLIEQVDNKPWRDLMTCAARVERVFLREPFSGPVFHEQADVVIAALRATQGGQTDA